MGLVTAWIFGGGATLWIAARAFARGAQESYWRNVLWSAATCVCVGCALLAIPYVKIASWTKQVSGQVCALVLVLIALVACVSAIGWVVRGSSHMSIRSRIGVWLPTLALYVLLLIMGMGVAGRLQYLLAETGRRFKCSLRLENLGRSIRLYRAAHGGDMPGDLEVLISYLRSEGYEFGQADVRGYFYRPYRGQADDESERAVACDLMASHGGDGRHVLLYNGNVLWLPEEQFQLFLNRPENAPFATRLREAEQRPTSRTRSAEDSSGSRPRSSRRREPLSSRPAYLGARQGSRHWLQGSPC